MFDDKHPRTWMDFTDERSKVLEKKRLLASRDRDSFLEGIDQSPALLDHFRSFFPTTVMMSFISF